MQRRNASQGDSRSPKKTNAAAARTRQREQENLERAARRLAEYNRRREQIAARKARAEAAAQAAAEERSESRPAGEPAVDRADEPFSP